VDRPGPATLVLTGSSPASGTLGLTVIQVRAQAFWFWMPCVFFLKCNQVPQSGVRFGQSLSRCRRLSGRADLRSTKSLPRGGKAFGAVRAQNGSLLLLITTAGNGRCCCSLSN
jgi:hypothetical protein